MIRIEPITVSPSIKIDRSPKVHEQADEIEAAWQRLCARNPRYFNGSMLAFDSYDPSTGEIHASVEQYKHHAVRDEIDLGISLLATTAIIVAINPHNQACYLLGKRSSATHRYGDLWEFGPSGGVDVPTQGIKGLDFNAICDELRREISEETGLELKASPGDSLALSAMALVHDLEVGSTDIAIIMTLDHLPAIKLNWEYTQTKWVTLDELVQWTQTHPQELIPTTISLARMLDESRS